VIAAAVIVVFIAKLVRAMTAIVVDVAAFVAIATAAGMITATATMGMMIVAIATLRIARDAGGVSGGAQRIRSEPQSIF